MSLLLFVKRQQLSDESTPNQNYKSTSLNSFDIEVYCHLFVYYWKLKRKIKFNLKDSTLLDRRVVFMHFFHETIWCDSNANFRMLFIIFVSRRNSRKRIRRQLCNQVRNTSSYLAHGKYISLPTPSIKNLKKQSNTLQ